MTNVIIYDPGIRFHEFYSRINSSNRFWNYVKGFMRHEAYGYIGGEYSLALLSEEAGLDHLYIYNIVLSFMNELVKHNILDIFLSDAEVGIISRNIFINKIEYDIKVYPW